MSKETQKAAPKAAKRPPKTKPSRNIKDPVLRSEAYTANIAVSRSAETLKRNNRLRELIEPETDAMVKVMIDIAKDARHTADPKKYPPIHASIRLEAADRVLNRAYGKPKEHVEISDPADAAGSQDEVMKLLGNIFEAVGLPTMLPAPEEPKAD